MRICSIYSSRFCKISMMFFVELLLFMEKNMDYCLGDTKYKDE